MKKHQTIFPVKVSHNGRYFIDTSDNPFFWLGTTQWQIFRDNTLDEVKTILENVKSKGFSVVQAMLLGVLGGPAWGNLVGPVRPNVYGEIPWSNNNPLTPNEAYFKNVDSIVEMARENGLVISMTLYHQRFGDYMNPKNARSWGKWVAQRYKDVPNIVWSMTPKANQEYVPILREWQRAFKKEMAVSILFTSNRILHHSLPASSTTKDGLPLTLYRHGRMLN